MDKAHIEHAVGFIEHHRLDRVEAEMTLSDQIEQPSRGSGQDIDPARHPRHLRVLADAAKDDERAQPEMPPIGAKAVADLQRQLAGRGQDKTAGSLALQSGLASRCGEALQDRQRESGGLAGTGLGDSQQIPAGEKLRDCLRLDRRRHGIAFVLERASNGFDEGQVFK